MPSDPGTPQWATVDPATGERIDVTAEVESTLADIRAARPGRSHRTLSGMANSVVDRLGELLGITEDAPDVH